MMTMILMLKYRWKEQKLKYFRVKHSHDPLKPEKKVRVYFEWKWSSYTQTC